MKLGDRLRSAGDPEEEPSLGAAPLTASRAASPTPFATSSAWAAHTHRALRAYGVPGIGGDPNRSEAELRDSRERNGAPRGASRRQGHPAQGAEGTPAARPGRRPRRAGPRPARAVPGRPDVTEIMVNGRDTVYVERSGKLEQHRRPLHLRGAPAPGHRADRLAGWAGGSTSPRRMVDARLADGSRVNAIIPPLAFGRVRP